MVLQGFSEFVGVRCSFVGCDESSQQCTLWI